LGDGSDLGAVVRYSWEQPRVLGSAGGPRHALDIVGAERFFIVNGDTLTDVDLHALADAHVQFGAEVTLALTPDVEANRYGGVRLDDDGRVVQFVPRGPAAVGSHHFTGVQIVNAGAIRELVDGQPVNSVGGLYDDLMRRLPGAVRGVVSQATFHDIGTIADYWTTSFQLAKDAQAQIGRSSRIASSAHITRSIVWDGASVDERCVVDRCIISDGVQLAPGTTLTRTIAAAEPGGGLRTWPLNIPFND
jgi:mannose-1-phosphate guanylyltransferase